LVVAEVVLGKDSETFAKRPFLSNFCVSLKL